MEQQLQMSGERSLVTDSDLSTVGETFKSVMSHMKNTLPFWEDLIQRGMKFQRQLETTIVAYNYFAEGFGRVADIAVRSKGGTRDMGTQLTTLVMWHKQLELKLRGLNQALATNFLASMQSKIQEFRQSAGTFEKECDKELKKSISEAKGACSKTVKTSKNLEKKTKKEKFDEVQALRTELSKKQQEASQRVRAVYDMEKRHLTKLLMEERTWYCTLIRDYQGVMNVGVSMTGDLQRLQDISQELSVTIAQSNVLPEKTVEFIAEMCPLASKGQSNDFQESLSVSYDSSRRGSYTPQPQRASSSGLSRRSQSFDQLDDTSMYTEIPHFSNSGHTVSPLTSSYSAVPPASLTHNSTPPPPIGNNPVPPPPPIGYSSAPPPPPPPVHKPAQPNTTQNEVEVHPEGPSPPAFTESVSPPYRYSGIDWHTDLKEKLRKRTESMGNCSPKRPSTPIEEQPSDADSFAQHRSLSLSSPTNQGRFSMTPPGTPPMKRSEAHIPPPGTPPMKRSEAHIPPPCRPKPNKPSVSSYSDENEEDDSPLAKALKAAKLKKAITNDRSAPRV